MTGWFYKRDIAQGLDMDVENARRHRPFGSDRIVARPHLPAFLWYGFWAALLGVLIVGVFRIAVWDGSAMMFVPIALLVAFGAPLFLVLRNLTSVAIVDAGAIELRRFAMTAWRLQQREVFAVNPTPGIIEGPWRLHALGSPVREVPGFLVRGMRDTWVEDLRNAPPSDVFAGMSREEKDAFVSAVHRADVEHDETFGTSPEERWQNAVRWDKQRRVYTGIAFALAVLSLLLPRYREVWALDVLLALAATGTVIVSRFRPGGLMRSGRGILLVIGSLLPGLIFTRGQFDWQILEPGIGTIALFVAGLIWIAALTPPWRHFAWKERVGYVILSFTAFSVLALWADRMLVFANMRFDETTMPVIEVANVLRVEEKAASRYVPASVIVDLGSTPTFGLGVTAQFAEYAVPGGDIAVGGQCILMIRPGLLRVRWREVAFCR